MVVDGERLVFMLYKSLSAARRQSIEVNLRTAIVLVF